MIGSSWFKLTCVIEEAKDEEWRKAQTIPYHGEQRTASLFHFDYSSNKPTTP